MTNRVSNHVPEALMLKIAEAAVSWCKLREIEKRYGDNSGLGADMRSAEMRMRAAMVELPDAPEVPPEAKLPWDAMSNRHDPSVESVALEIYSAWAGEPDSAWVPWVDHGNSLMQDHARGLARQILRRDGYTGGA